MARWEYHTLVYDGRGQGWFSASPQGEVDETRITAALNELGAQGWELVSSFDTNDYKGSTRLVVFVFKRAVG